MSQSLSNDLPDRFGSSDEDDDDEEVVGWMGETGEFEARTGIHATNEDDVEVGPSFSRRGLFQDRWEGDFQDDDDFGFHGLDPREPGEEHETMVHPTLKQTYLQSSEEEEEEDSPSAESDLNRQIGSSEFPGITEAVRSLNVKEEGSPGAKSSEEFMGGSRLDQKSDLEPNENNDNDEASPIHEPHNSEPAHA